MSKLETWMTRWYWNSVGGTLVEEFPAVGRGINNGPRLIDGIIVKNGENRIAKWSEVSIEGKDIIVVQTKASRLGMYLMGQACFSAHLMQRLKPNAIVSVALCCKDDSVLRPIFESYPNMRVLVCPEEARPNETQS